MEPCDGTEKMLRDNLNLLYQHRGKNSSASNTPDTSFTGDSGYGSYLTTSSSSSNNTPNQSSSFSSSTNLATITSTPQRLSNTTSNLSTIFENSDSIKLTPVTQNIRNIHNFHITTPTDEQQQQQQPVVSRKRNSVTILNFEITPKKSKFDEEFCLQATPEEALSANSTPRKNISRSTKKRAFRQNLKSAPDLSGYFNENHNAENEESPRRTNLSPIHCKSTTRVSRTPLSSSSSNLILASTPKSSNNSGLYEAKTSSVKKLLTFSDSKFEQLLNSGRGDKVESAVSKTTALRKISSDLFENNDDDDSIKPLDDLLTPSPIDCSGSDDITSEQASRNYKTVISSVLRDRELSLLELSSSRSSQQAKQLRFAQNRIGGTIKSATSTATSSLIVKNSNKDKTEPESQGFQDLLNINNDCHDMEISSICDCNRSLIEQVPITTNYSIKSNVDLELNATITCETIPDRLTPVNLSSPDSMVALPRTPKKSKSISIGHESLEILYPTIFRTPSKYNPLTRAPRKRKSENDLWNSLVKRPCFYDGCDYLNIIVKLNESKCDHILDRIYESLSSHDLVNMCKVSTAWKGIVQSSRRASYQIKRHLRNCQISKENNGRETEKDFSSGKEKGKDYDFRRFPLNQNNSRITQKRAIIRSPPVSPSKRKFHENQKVVKTLEPNEKLIKCPRCSKSSRIYKNNGLSGIKSLRSSGDIFNRTVASTSASNRFNTLLTPTMSSFDLTEVQFTTNNNNNIVQKQQRLTKALSLDSKLLESETSLQFAECSGLTCKYRFCLKCFCDYHPGNKCSLYEPNSPIEDDLQNGLFKLASSSPRSIKSARKKALKRLCL